MRERLLLLTLLGGALAAVTVACGSESKSGARPNVLVVVMDTARGDRCSFTGYGRETTPRLAAIARDGVTFLNAWSCSPWTGPSHASIFTGLRPERHGFCLGNREYLRGESLTLAEQLRDSGYETACLTSNFLINERNGLAQGFAFYRTIDDLPDTDDPACRILHRHGLEWVREQQAAAKPWFLFVNDIEPHLPYTPPPEHQATFVDGLAPGDLVARARGFVDRDMPVEYALGLRKVSADQWAVMSDLYDAEIASVDAGIGALVDALAADGILDDTILVVLSDHGENLGDHGLASHKYSLHRTLLHVPLLIRYPGTFDGGREVRDVVRTEDLLPTVLELCGLPVPKGIDGRTLTGETAGRISRAMFGRASLEPGARIPPAGRLRRLQRLRTSIRSVFDGRWHLIVHSDGHEELYDVVADPEESRDRAPDAPPELERLRTRLAHDVFAR